MRRRRSTMVCLGLTAVLATSLAGCGSEEQQGEGGGDPEYTGICVDKSTGVRLDDAVCENDPLPDEKDFQAQSAVNAGADPAIAPSTTGAASSGAPGASGTPSGSGAATGTSTPTATAPTTTAPDTSLPTTPGTAATTTSGASGTGGTAAIPSCVPSTVSVPPAATITATLPTEASPTASTAPTTFEGACPPGQVPAGPSGAPATMTTTVYRHSTSHGWFFIPWGFWSPPIGQRATYGNYAPPTGTTYSRGGMSRSGGTVTKSTVSGGKVSTSRGGFGGSGSKGGS